MGVFPVMMKLNIKERFMCLKIQACIKTAFRRLSERFQMLSVVEVHCVLRFLLFFISKNYWYITGYMT